MGRSKSWDPQERKKNILDSAVKVLNRKIFYKCPVDEIARTAGIAKGTVYLYFKSKEELYLSVAFSLIDKFIALVEDVSRLNIPASGQIKELLTRMSIFLKTHRRLFLSIREDSGPLKGKIHEKFREKFLQITEVLSRIVEKGIREKEFKKYPPYLVSSIILSLTSIYAHREFRDGSAGGEIEPAMILNILMRGLAK